MPNPHIPQIEKGILPPEVNHQRKSVSRILKEMEVGDSFLLPKIKYGGLIGCARSVGVRTMRRSVSETEYRIWKTA